MIWKDIPGFETYQASACGKIRRIAHGRNGWRPHILRGHLLKSNGYFTVCCTVPGQKPRNVTVHRLVCVAFHGPAPSPTHEVAHADGNRTNNAAANLRWATRKENAADRKRHGRDRIGSRNRSAKLFEQNIPLIFELAAKGFEQRRIAALFGIHQRQVFNVLHRRTWAHVEIPSDQLYSARPNIAAGPLYGKRA